MLTSVLKRYLYPSVPETLSRNFRKHVESNKLKHAVSAYVAREKPAGWFDTDAGRKNLEDHLIHRLDIARQRIVPWINHNKPLATSRILEIGCGTGSDTVAFAEQGAVVTGVDIDEAALDVARLRTEAYNVNARFVCINASDIANVFANEQFDIILFYASLEHMTIDERLTALAASWSLLYSGDLLGIVETPNRLWWFDSHTSNLPFFHWLPDELAFRYSQFSKRSSFGGQYSDAETQMIDFLRRGRGMSFHEFQLAIESDLNVLSSLVILTDIIA